MKLFFSFLLASVLVVCALGAKRADGGVAVNVMLPLSIIDNNGNLKDPGYLKKSFHQLKEGGTDGVMTDVWWGIVEKDGPRQYNWKGYLQLAQLVRDAGLKMQVVMSFHRCKGNIGDTCDIELPYWVTSTDCFYKDQYGNMDKEYMSLGCDNVAKLSGRTGHEVYADYMESFASAFDQFLGSTINDVQVGLGPAGELRYPSYQLDKWNFPGIGAFQCYDSYMLASLANAGCAAGHCEWNEPPSDAGGYDDQPQNTPFFRDGGGYKSAYGQFFLGWYSDMLMFHGQLILQSARSTFERYSGVTVSAKVAGIHWWFLTESHAAELTAGYYNTRDHDGYTPIARMFKSLGVTFDFTCLEMTDKQQHDQGCWSCGPEELVGQVEYVCNNQNERENALPIFDMASYNQVIYEADRFEELEAFTYLRMCDNLLNNGGNWNNFKSFVIHMHGL